MTKKVGVGVIGAGRIGRIHAESVVTRILTAELAAIADVYLPAAEAVGQQYNVPLVTDDYKAILADETIQAVAICSSTDTHAQIIEEAAQAGKHIFCENRLTMT